MPIKILEKIGLVGTKTGRSFGRGASNQNTQQAKLPIRGTSGIINNKIETIPQ